MLNNKEVRPLLHSIYCFSFTYLLVAEARKANPGEKVEIKPTKKQLKKPKFVKFGLRHVTALVESKKARLVIIAHDVDPLEVSISFSNILPFFSNLGS